MPTKTNTTQPWTAQDVYILLMQEIEPELLPDVMDTLDEKYAGETEEQRKNRINHYVECFDVFLDRFDILMKTVDTNARTKFADMIKTIKEKAKNADMDSLTNISKLIQES
jgi:hypothetical protein